MHNNTLPENFNGTFYFTNTSDEDFTAKWGGIAYTFPARKTSPMVIINATPLEVQNIRKKFAREFAEREIMKTDRIKQFDRENTSEAVKGFRTARTYFEKDLEPFINSCLEPLVVATADEVKTAAVEKPVTDQNFKKGRRKSIVLSSENSDIESMKAAYLPGNEDKLVV